MNKIWSREEELEVKPEEGISLGVHDPENVRVANSKGFMEVRGAGPPLDSGDLKIMCPLKAAAATQPW